MIGYTKNHPIYTESFEKQHERYLFFFDTGAKKPYGVLGYLRLHASLFHVDAANADYFFSLVTCPIVIECEGRPRNDFFTNRRIKEVFVESKWAGSSYLQTKKVKLLYPGINSNGKTGSVAKDKPVTICAVGHGGMVKGFDVVVRLFRELSRLHNIRLIIAGSFGHNFEYYPEISQEAYSHFFGDGFEVELKKDPRILFRPFKRKDLLATVYPEVDIYLHLSRLETFGFSILEALSNSLPVIGTRLHAIPEMVTHGYNGFLVDPFAFDINSIQWHNKAYEDARGHLEALITDDGLRREISLNAAKSAMSFSIDKKMDCLRKVYDNIITD